jgi:hypothetical protein
LSGAISQNRRSSTDEKGVSMATVRTDIWLFRDTAWAIENLVGFNVEALDGRIGKIDESSTEVGASWVVVDTGPWIFGKKVMLPAGVIGSVDSDTETVFVHRTKEQIKSAPEFDPARYHDDSYRGDLAIYYGEGGAGWQSW